MQRAKALSHKARKTFGKPTMSFIGHAYATHFSAIGEANSVFVTIVRGEYDGVLPWPFSCPITFTMVNQAKGADVSLTITPRITENNLLFLDRPKADRNPAFGLKSFVDLRFMKSKDEFVRDDCCFIRVDVDLSPIYDYI